MRNASIEQYDATPRAVVAMGTDYPDGYLATCCRAIGTVARNCCTVPAE